MHDVQKSGCYALICDETWDITVVKRLACVLRFVNMDSCEPTEAILDKSLAEGLDVESTLILSSAYLQYLFVLC